MIKIMLLALSLLMSTMAFSNELEVEGQPMVAVGIRSGSSSDINNSPAVYGSLKFSFLQYRGDTTLKFLVPGIGVQSGTGKAYINLSIAPIVVENRAGWGFGLDVFTSIKNTNKGRGALGFFVGKSF